jgi:uncharacterized protein YqfA (UPF0365 family)
VITLYFEDSEVQNKWAKYLREATGNFSIKDYYNFNNKASTLKRYSKPIGLDEKEEELKLTAENNTS